MAKSNKNIVGSWTFIVGVAVVIGVAISTVYLSIESSIWLISAVMAVIGILVGALNITDSEVTNFIIAALGLAAASIGIANLGTLLTTAGVGLIGGMINTAFTMFGVFIGGVLLVPSLKAVYRLAKD